MLAREARLAHAEKRFMACRMACQQLLKLRKNDPDALLMLAAADFGEGKSHDAILQMQKYVRLYPKDVDSRCYLAQMLTEVGRYREAVVQYDKALRHAPHHPEAIAGKGRALDLSGEPGRAMKLLEPYLTGGRATPAIARVFANCLMNAKDYERAIDLARPFAENHGGDVVSAAGLWFIIGQSLERLDRAEESFAAYTNANRVNAQPFDPVAFERRIDDLMEIYSEANLAKLPRAEDRSDAPVILACLPRSGSTLVERILSSHPAVHAAGELNTISRIAHEMQLAIGSTVEYPRCALDLEREDVNTLGRRYLDELRKLDRKAARFTNKDLFLWENLGLIELLLPARG
jgi:tetratricopeptide (TPR) repeat protein